MANIWNEKVAQPSNASSFSQQDIDNDFAESGLSDDFREQYNAIYKAYDPNTIQNTFWDKVSNFFGFRSSADKARLQLDQNRREALAQLSGIKREQDYNDPAAKAARLRLAGINPDLQGISAANDASEFSEPSAASDLSGLSTGEDAAGKFANVLTTTLSLFSGIQGIKMAGLDIASKELQNAVSGQDGYLNLIKGIFSSNEYKENFDPNSGEFHEILPGTLRDLGIRSRRAQKLVNSYARSIFNSFKGQTEAHATFGDWISSLNKEAESRGKWYRKGKDEADVDGMAFALQEYSGYLMEADRAQAKYQSSYYAALNAGDQAKAQNAAAQFQAFQAKSKKDLYNRLVGDSKNSSGQAKLFPLLLATTLMGDNNLGSSAFGLAGSVAKFL